MQIEVYKKLWVNCHLMYPNSSQARDVFSHLVTVSKKENRKMSVSIHVHHGLVDGYHVGKFVELLQKFMDS